MKYSENTIASKTIYLLFIAAVPALLLACANEANNMDDQNATGDNQPMSQEVGSVDEGWFDFSEWDIDSSGALGEDEFIEGLFGKFDADGDGLISEAEWTESEGLFGDVSFNFDDWDTDGDGIIGSQEFQAGLNDAGLFEEWDTDNNDLLEEGELNTIFEPGT